MSDDLKPADHSFERPALLNAVDLIIEQIVDRKLASLGGDLLSTYGHRAKQIHDADAGLISIPREQGDWETLGMAALGGYLLERYGTDNTPPEATP